MGILEYFGRLLGPSGTDAHEPHRSDVESAVRPSALSSQTGATTNSHDRQKSQFERELTRIVDGHRESGAPIVAGSIEIVGLDEIKEVLGERWDEISGKAAALAEHEIRVRLAHGDILRVHSETEFAICFSNLDRAQAMERARGISREVKQVLLKELPDFSTMLSVKRFVAEVSIEELDYGGGSLADRLVTIMGRLRLEADTVAMNCRKLLLKDFQVMFAPIWEPRHERVQMNRCVLDLTVGFSTLSQFQAVADPDKMAETLADLDCLVLTKALEALHQTRRSNNIGASIVIPVGFQTLSMRDTRVEYAKLLEAVPEVYKPLVRLQITALPSSCTPDQVQTVLDTLATYSQGLILQLNGNPDILESLTDDLLWGVSWSVTGLDGKDPVKQTLISETIEYASSRGLRTLANGANSIGLALSAVEAGFDYVDGTAIHLCVDAPRAPSRLHPLTYPRRLTNAY